MYSVTIQCAVSKKLMPSAKQLKNWALTVLKPKIAAAEVTIRVVKTAEMTDLNSQYRKKQAPTNVLAFPLSEAEEQDLCGDIVICAEVVNEEAKIQGKANEAHWAHMVVHGTLHLLGYDHLSAEDAAIMEPEEIHILQSLGFKNPYSY